jgi:hypothetical protein
VLRLVGSRASGRGVSCSGVFEIGDENGADVVVPLASPARAFLVGLGELRPASAQDQLVGPLGGEDIEELSPVGEVKAVDEPGRPVAEQGGAANVGDRE